MRDIKFRVWDKELNEMLYSTNLEWYDDSFGFRLNKHIEEIEFKLMQYTGRKDINNKEVYEGDIVRCKDYYDEDRPIFVGVVDFRDCSFIIVDSLITNYRWMDYEVEVIGNIYENKDSLEELE